MVSLNSEIPLPEADESEECVVAFALQSPDAAIGLMDRLRADDFRSDYLGQTWRLMRSVYDANGCVIDINALADLAAARGLMADYSPANLAELMDDRGTPELWKFHADRIIDASTRRKLFYLSQELAKRATSTEDIGTLIAELTERSQRITAERGCNLLGGMDGLCPADTPLYEPLIDGLLRVRESLNLIAATKVGKSWLVAYVALCIVTGRPIFGVFGVRQGDVVYIDNELHAPTLNYRIKTVAAAMGIHPDDYRPHIHAHCLRGRLTDIEGLGRMLATVPPGRVKAVIVDAKYRLEKEGTSENDNGAATQFYNLIDSYAARLEAAFILVHHASKGLQAEKTVTDVGAGAGAQSRAVDAHVVLRPHETADHCVLDAALRSFPKLEPVVLRWEWPLWSLAVDEDPAKLKVPSTRRDVQQEAKDRDGIEKITKALRKDRILTRNKLEMNAGIGRPRLNKLLIQMEEDESICKRPVIARGNVTDEFWLSDDEGAELLASAGSEPYVGSSRFMEAMKASFPVGSEQA